MSELIKLLLVDDVPANLVAFDATLRREGLQILCASSGAEALELLLAHDVALAFVDVHMPGMDGFELAELMRGAARSKHVPIIFVTAAGYEAARLFRGYESGAVDFLFKPVDSFILRQKADIFLELYRQRQQLSEQLQVIQQREALLKTVTADLERAVQMRDDILAVVSHDLRDPLQTIRMSSVVLAHRAAHHSDAQATQLCQVLQRSTDRMQRMIGDLLDMAALRAGRLTVSTAPQSLTVLLNECATLHSPACTARGMRLELAMPAADASVLCDRERVLQVLGNLIGNACKFGKSGGAIKLSASINGALVTVSVADDGPGIAAADQPHLFLPYWSATKDRSKGTGLGLYISQGIIGAHNGRIWAESNPGAGSVFHFTLPLAG